MCRASRDSRKSLGEHHRRVPSLLSLFLVLLACSYIFVFVSCTISLLFPRAFSILLVLPARLSFLTPCHFAPTLHKYVSVLARVSACGRLRVVYNARESFRTVRECVALLSECRGGAATSTTTDIIRRTRVLAVPLSGGFLQCR